MLCCLIHHLIKSARKLRKWYNVDRKRLTAAVWRVIRPLSIKVIPLFHFYLPFYWIADYKEQNHTKFDQIKTECYNHIISNCVLTRSATADLMLCYGHQILYCIYRTACYPWMRPHNIGKVAIQRKLYYDALSCRQMSCLAHDESQHSSKSYTNARVLMRSRHDFFVGVKYLLRS